MRTVRSASGARSQLRACAAVRSELENEVRGEDNGHARDRSSTDLCMFGLAACDEGGPGMCQHERTDGHQCETSWSAVSK